MTGYEEFIVSAGQFLAAGESFEHFSHVIDERKGRAAQAVLGKVESVRSQDQRTTRRRNADNLKPASMTPDPVQGDAGK